MNYESTSTVASKVIEGVRFTITRMSFGRRIELMRRVRDLSARLEYEQAGDRVEEQIEASLLRAEIDQLYLRWGLRAIEGIAVDDKQPDLDILIATGPEALCREIIAAIKSECALSQEERKN